MAEFFFRRDAELLFLVDNKKSQILKDYAFAYEFMRTDDDVLSFRPSLPKEWNGFSFRILYRDKVLSVDIRGGKATFTLDGDAEPIRIFDKEYMVGKDGVSVEL